MQTSTDDRMATSVGANRRVKTLIGGSIGHFIEWYDWAIYGLMAGVIAAQMFPAADPTVSLISSLSAFAIGFIGRPMCFSMGDMRMDFVAEEFLLSFSQPNFYFHATTAYDILRWKGVPLGKRDYIGRPRIIG